jgi:lipopolysaccharide assembly protein A
MQIFLYFGLFIAILAILFAIQNNDPVTVSFIFWNFRGSLALILLIAMAAGALISSLISIPSSFKAHLASRNQRKKTEALEACIEELNITVEEQKTELQDNLKKLKEMQSLPYPSEITHSSEELQENDHQNNLEEN